MYNGGPDTENAPLQLEQPITAAQARRHCYVKIIEQPAPKALRFRYECEGRCAGSIPGVSSTPENKTYPAIQVIGYKGRAVVVVSCVTKDPPYRPHPHNLVGRDGCRKGVCTLEISPETMSVTFPNLGIQCVKKKDIESALRQREEIRVDPFRTGFSHRNQPTSIDLNAVRLCFQVFLEGERGRFTIPLTPVVSESIYDKKAMSDLVIVKLSDCVTTVDGGKKDIILLCEKVAKEDIQVRFYEEKENQVVWEGFADFQPSQVHKQTAIWFRPPRYRTLEITEPVKVYIQLRRPSDGSTSEPLPFQFLPLDSGRPAFWSFRRNLTKKENYNFFSTILANDTKMLNKRQLGSIPPIHSESISHKCNVKLSENIVSSSSNNSLPMDTSDQSNSICKPISSAKIIPDMPEIQEEKSFNELIDQVAELDEIYSQTRIRKLSGENNLNDETFDDTKTYTSLQMAFANPIKMKFCPVHEDSAAVTPLSPISEVSNLKRENETEKLPPLPPKRSKKVTDICEPYVPKDGSMQNIQLSEKQAQLVSKGSNQSLFVKSASRSSLNLHRPRSQGDLSPPSKKLPPKPTGTLPNPKKSGFLSKLFSRKKDKDSNRSSREQSAAPSENNLLTGSKLPVAESNLKNASSGNLSICSNRSNADSIHIPLKDLEMGSKTGQSKTVLTTDLNANDDVLFNNMDLTEAEHYALYTAIAPHATQSEFDEMSCYYAAVEGGKIFSDNFVRPKT
ncbi:embryonic polarity protein dorsal isoform X2 [Agrilus planipennis]|nr:embryonic polarity protein dorsal isoform X2 [Agrilus planipennis]